MKEVWLVTYNFGSVKAGPAIRFMRYAPIFKSLGYKLVFVTKFRDGDLEEAYDELSGVFSKHLKCDDLADLTKQAINLAKIADSKPKAILYLSLSYKASAKYAWAKKNGIRQIYVSTMKLNTSEALAKTGGKLRKWVLEKVLRKTYSQMDFIVSSTKDLEKDFTDLSIDKSKLNNIYNGVNLEKFSPVKSDEEKLALRKELGLPENQLLFLFVGLFIDRKGVDELANWVAKANSMKMDFKLLIVGQEKEGLVENSARFNEEWPRIKELGIQEGWLLCHPFASDVSKYYKAADAFVFNSRLEGMPNVILEAMASGIPMITRRFEGFSEDYGMENAEFLCFGDEPSKNFENLKFLLNSNNRKKIGGAARTWSERHFSVQTSVLNYIKLIGE